MTEANNLGTPVPVTVEIEYIGGYCPVQAEGLIAGKPFYFRARGQHWTLSIGGDDPVVNPEWHCRETYSDEPFAAGYLTEEEARRFIEEAASRYVQFIAGRTGPQEVGSHE